jgi:hypothetical protein
MPPQVQRAEPGTPVNSQAPVSTEQSKTAEVDKNATQKPEPPKQDAQTAAKNAEAAKQHAGARKQQNVADEQIVRNKLGQRVPDKKTDIAVNQSDKGAWGFVKDAARLASDAAGAGVTILRNSIERASGVDEETIRKKQLQIERKMEEIDIKRNSE